jgi:hypothetical protein
LKALGSRNKIERRELWGPTLLITLT